MKLFTAKEVSKILKFKEQTVRNMIHEGRIHTVKIMNSVRITQEELERITGIKYEE